jgi:hypothetical protein
MAEQGTEEHRTTPTTPTTPDATDAIVDLTEGAEAFSEPSGTVAEARREGAEVPEDTPALDDAAARQDRLEEARQRMWETPQHSSEAEGLGAQEEETARIADHLVFPGAGMREMRERADLDPTAQGIGPGTGELPPTEDSDGFPPTEWPPKEGGEQ